MEKKKTSFMILGVCALVLSVIGVTYAFWQLRLAQKDQNTIGSSCFDVELIDEKDAIQLEKAYPILDEDAITLKPYKFTIKNHCDANASYQINLEALSQYGSTTIAANIRLKPEYIRAQLNEVNKENEEEIEIEKAIVNLDSTIQVSPTLNDTQAKSYDAFKLATGYLGPQESKSFALRIWLDGDLTMEDEDAMNKTFASKITVTASYLTEEKVPPTVDLELAVCENTITATGKATPAENKSIEKYEFKLDADENWTSGVEQLKEFNVEKPGNHSVSLRVTDNKGITSETSKTVETGELKTVNIYGKDIPITTCKNGLYEVEHKDAEALKMAAKWQETEYRFAGVDYVDDSTPYVHNYVWFNSDDGCTKEGAEDEKHCELWRIIGLVNVKTGNGDIEQRLKIIRDDKLPSYMRWNIGDSNDWTKASLMTYLNSGEYYTTQLKDNAKGMIDENIIWNLGGTENYTTEEDGLVTHWYGYERGTKTGNSDAYPAEWKKDETNAEAFHSIALPYPSDYAYATNGGTLGRKACFEKELSLGWGSGEYKTQCAETDWLEPKSMYMWFLSPLSSTSSRAFRVFSGGYVCYDLVDVSNGVWPALYLSPSVIISSGTGEYNSPYKLSVE